MGAPAPAAAAAAMAAKPQTEEDDEKAMQDLLNKMKEGTSAPEHVDRQVRFLVPVLVLLLVETVSFRLRSPLVSDIYLSSRCATNELLNSLAGWRLCGNRFASSTRW